MSALSKTLKPIFESISFPIIKALSDNGIDPNLITVSGIFFVGVGSFLLYEDNNVLSSIVLLLGALMDAIDGALARYSNRVSKFGALLDSSMDRIGDALPFFAFIAIAFKLEDFSLLALSFFAFLFSFMVSYVRARAEGLLVKMDKGTFERPERWAVLIFGIFFGLYKFTLIILLIGSAYTVLERLFYAKKKMESAL